MRDHDGAPESWKTRNKCSEQSPDRPGGQAGVNQPPQQCSFPLKPSDSPSIDLRIDDNCKRSRHPPHSPDPDPDPDPLLRASSPSWPSLDPCGLSEVLLCCSAGCLWGDFSIKHTSVWERREELKIPGLFFGERRRMKTNDVPRLIIDPPLSQKHNEARGAADYKWP